MAMTAALYSMEAEQSVLGSVMFSPQDCDAAFDRLNAGMFHDEIHGALWTVMDGLRRRGMVADPVTVDAAMSSHAGYHTMGGVSFLALLADKAAVYAVDAHVEVIVDRAARRAIQTLAGEIGAQAADTSEGTAETVLGDLERGAAEIGRTGASGPRARPVGLTAMEMVQAAREGRYRGVPVGLDAIDRVTGGIAEDDVWFIGGRTSMGKSVMGLCLGRGIAEQGRGVHMFSLEMPEKEVQARLIADIAFDKELMLYGPDGGNARFGDVLQGRGTPQQFARVDKAAKQLASLPFLCDDRGGLTIDEIRRHAQRQIRAWDKAGVERGAIIIDHIGLVKPTRHRGDGNKAAETADVVNELKAMAKQLKTPIIALCQVNRANEKANDKRPQISDLNWSGAIEQIADLVCLLYREAYYIERDPNGDHDQLARCKHEMELLIHKNRKGPICTKKAFVDIGCNAIRDIEESPRRQFA